MLTNSTIAKWNSVHSYYEALHMSPYVTNLWLPKGTKMLLFFQCFYLLVKRILYSLLLILKVDELQ